MKRGMQKQAGQLAMVWMYMCACAHFYITTISDTNSSNCTMYYLRVILGKSWPYSANSDCQHCQQPYDQQVQIHVIRRCI